MLTRVKDSIEKVADVTCQKIITGNEQSNVAVMPLSAAFDLFINELLAVKLLVRNDL